ncbi:hypothetical protein R3983_01085, partial [Serratia marcescens]
RSFKTKIHGLRMLDGRVLGNYPLSSADSTSLACNVPKTKQKYPELTRKLFELGCSDDEIKAGRCAILKGAIEKVVPPSQEKWMAEYSKSRSKVHPLYIQGELFA